MGIGRICISIDGLKTNIGGTCYQFGFRKLTDKHTAVAIVGDGEKMRWHFGSSLAAIFADDIRRVDRKTAVRVDDDAKQARVGLKDFQSILLIS